MRPFLTLILILLFFLALPASADVIWLKQGDRLTGNIELLQGNRLLLRTSAAGRISINLSQISTLESDRWLLINVRGQPRHISRIGASDTPGQIRLLDIRTESVEVPLADLRQLLPPRPVIEDWVWEGKASLGLDFRYADNRQRDLDVLLGITARHANWRHTLNGEFEQDDRNGKKRNHRWQTDYALSWFFADQWFWLNSLSYQRDYLKETRQRTQLGTGPGYEWWNTALGSFETSLRLDFLHLENRDHNSRDSTALGFEWSWRRFLSARQIELFFKGETSLPADSDISAIIDTELGMIYKLNSWASLSLRTEWEYLNSDRNDEELNNLRYRLALGIQW